MIAEELRVVIKAEADRAIREMGQVQSQSRRTAGELTKLVAGWASVGAAVALFVKEVGASLKAFAEIEEAQNKVAAALRVTGENVEDILPRYQDLAAEIQRTTVVSDGATFGMIALAQSMGVTSRDMDRVVKGAVGLSRTFGMDANTAVRALTNAMEGNFGQLERYIPAVRNAATEAEKMAAVQEAMANGFEIAKSEIDTLAGAQAQYQNTLSDLRESMGQFVAGPARAMLQWATDLVGRLAAGQQEINNMRDATRAVADGTATAEQEMRVLRQEAERLTNLLADDMLNAYARNADAARTRLEAELLAVNRQIRSTEARIQAAERERAEQEELMSLNERNAAIAKRAAEERERWDQMNLTALERRMQFSRDLTMQEMSAKERALYLIQEEINKTAALRTEAQKLGQDYSQIERLFQALAAERDKLRESIADDEAAAAQAEANRLWNEHIDILRRAADARREVEEANVKAAEEEARAFWAARNAERERNEMIRSDFAQLTQDRLAMIREEEKAFIAAGVSKVDASRWAAQEIAKEYARQIQEVMNWFSQLGASAMQVWQELHRAQQQQNQAEIQMIRDEMREMDMKHRKALEQARIEQRMLTNQHSLEMAFAEAAGASDRELAQIRLEHVRQRIQAEEMAAEREAELDAEREAAQEAAAEREAAIRKDAFEKEKQMRIANAIMAGAQAFINALASIPFPFNLGAGALIAGLTAAQVGTIRGQKAPAFERGGSFVTNGPQMIQVGDGQSPRERVTVEPLTGPYANHGGEGITININGVVGGREAVAEWVAEGIRRGQERGRIGKIA